MTQLNIRIPDIEVEVLDRYCQSKKRTRTDVLREFIRSLEKQDLHPPVDESSIRYDYYQDYLARKRGDRP